MIEKKAKEKLIELVTAMLDYTKYHFASKEKFMKSINYPRLPEHQENHRAYEIKITEFYQRIREDKLILSLEVVYFGLILPGISVDMCQSKRRCNSPKKMLRYL